MPASTAYRKGCGACGASNAVQALHCATCGTKFTTAADRKGLLARVLRSSGSRQAVARDLDLTEVQIPEGVDPGADAFLAKMAEKLDQANAKS